MGLIYNKNFELLISGNSGIGRSTLRMLCKEGRNVIVTYRTYTEELSSVIHEYETLFDVVLIPLKLDLTKGEDVQNLKVFLHKNKIILNSMIILSGKAHGGRILSTHIDDIKNVFDINFFCQINLIQELHRFLTKQGDGTIILTSSIVGFDKAKGAIAYGGSKSLINYSIPILAEELSFKKVRVNGIAPSLIDTPMASQMGERESIEMINRSFSQRLGSPDEVSNVILYLLSSHSKFINGQIIRIDGGMF